MTRVDILGVRIDQGTKEEVLSLVRDFLLSQQSHTIFTPNPEMIVDAQKYPAFKRTLNASHMNICDGFGITLVSILSSHIPHIELYHGIDCMSDICGVAEDMQKKVYLIGSGDEETVMKAKAYLQKKFPNLSVVGAEPGPYIASLTSDPMFAVGEDENERSIDRIIDAAPDILFVGFGHRKQEWWIQENIKHLPSVKIAMGVGGSIDMFGGKVKRASRMFRTLHIEWLWRVIRQPWRIRRIWNATVTFLYMYFIKHS